MSAFIKNIMLDKENHVFKNYVFDNDLGGLINLKKINIFSGANNSGKSRLMREIYKKSSELEYEIVGSSWNGDTRVETKQALNDLRICNVNTLTFRDKLLKKLLGLKEFSPVLFDLEGIESLIDQVKVGLESKPCDLMSKEDIHKMKDFISGKIGIDLPVGWELVESKIDRLDFDTSRKVYELIQSINEIIDNITCDYYEFNCLYIPVMRSLKIFGEFYEETKKEDGTLRLDYSLTEKRTGKKEIIRKFRYFDDQHVLKNSIIHDYFYEKDKNRLDQDVVANVASGENIYNIVHVMQNGVYEERKKKKDFERLLGKYFFEGKEVVLTAIDDHFRAVYVKIGDEVELPIHDLGDGVQSIILTLLPVFQMAGNNVVAFIEEPENHLHPGFQRVFMEILADIPNVQVFITTHSNHLMDLTTSYSAKMSLYNFSKASIKTATEENAIIVSHISSDLENIYRELGIKLSSINLVNSTIWVEGITDRIYLRHYLKLFQEERMRKGDAPYLLEDVDYSFVEYGGSNITHWSFLDGFEERPLMNVDKICAKALLIADGDLTYLKPNSKKAKRLTFLREKLGDMFIVIERNEIENIITPDILEKTILHFAKIKGINIIPPNLKYEEYEKTGLGTYLDQKLCDHDIISFSTKSGSIKDKVNFAMTAISFMQSIEDLSKEAIQLAERIYYYVYTKKMI